MRWLLPCLTISTLLWVHAAQAQEAWRNTRFGDSVEAVRQKMPEATGQVENDTGSLTVDGFALGGVDYSAVLEFEGHGLSEVILRPKETSTTNLAMIAATRLEADLARKYGHPTSCGTENLYGVQKYKCTWLYGGTQIELFVLGMRGEKANMFISYRRDPGPNDNL